MRPECRYSTEYLFIRSWLWFYCFSLASLHLRLKGFKNLTPEQERDKAVQLKFKTGLLRQPWQKTRMAPRGSSLCGCGTSGASSARGRSSPESDRHSGRFFLDPPQTLQDIMTCDFKKGFEFSHCSEITPSETGTQ